MIEVRSRFQSRLKMKNVATVAMYVATVIKNIRSIIYLRVVYICNNQGHTFD